MFVKFRTIDGDGDWRIIHLDTQPPQPSLTALPQFCSRHQSLISKAIMSQLVVDESRSSRGLIFLASYLRAVASGADASKPTVAIARATDGVRTSPASLKLPFSLLTLPPPPPPPTTGCSSTVFGEGPSEHGDCFHRSCLDNRL